MRKLLIHFGICACVIIATGCSKDVKAHSGSTTPAGKPASSTSPGVTSAPTQDQNDENNRGCGSQSASGGGINY